MPKRLWLAALCALILVGLTHVANGPGAVPESIQGAVNVIQWSALLVGMLVSGNAHAPNEWVFYATLFAMYFAACLALIGAFRIFTKRASRDQPSHSSARKP